MCFLMDEPLGALDAEFRAPDVRRAARAAQPASKATTVYVTHDQIEAMSMADKIAVMNQRRDRAVRPAAGDLRPAGQHVRRRLHRLAADELPALPRRHRARRRAKRCCGDAVIAHAGAARGRRAARPGAGRPARAYRASTTARRCAARSMAASIWARPRSSPSTPPFGQVKARHQVDRRGEAGRDSRPAPRLRAGCRCSTQSGPRRPLRLVEGAAHG